MDSFPSNASNTQSVQNQPQSNMNAPNFWYNNALFLFQAFFSMMTIGFSAGMLIAGKDPSIYLPVLTSVTAFWLPSPINHKVPDMPSGIPQLQAVFTRRTSMDSLDNV
jgi:hypothetical protein